MEPARKHFSELLDELKERVLHMGSLADQMVDRSVQSVIRRDKNLAREVLEQDDELDKMELEIQSTCMILIAREQPVAQDLRHIASSMAISMELERVGDHAVSIAKKALTIPDAVPFDHAKSLSAISDKARSMLATSLRAFATDDLNLLDEVIAADTEVDELWKSVRMKLKEDIRQNPELLDQDFKLIRAFHHLEYVADHAVSIAERLSFVHTGNLVRFSRARI
jgi:phosphate transport system protein